MHSRFQLRRGLRHRSAVAHLLILWLRIPLGTWMFVCCECCVLWGRGLCDQLTTRPGQTYRLWCVDECDLATSWMKRPWPTGGCCAKRKKWYADLIKQRNSLFPSTKSNINLSRTAWQLLHSYGLACFIICWMYLSEFLLELTIRSLIRIRLPSLITVVFRTKRCTSADSRAAIIQNEFCKFPH